jgi:hypothetical protein
MDGRQKADQQRLRGTRSIVEELDGLRIQFGFDKVQVLTPIVESKLRSGQEPARALRVAVPLCAVASLEFMFQIGYPTVPVNLDVLYADDSLIQDVRDQLLQTVQEYSASGNGGHKWSQLVSELKMLLPETLLPDMISPVDLESAPETDEEEQQTLTDVPAAVNAGADSLVDTVSVEVPTPENAAFCCKVCRTVLFEGAQLHEHSLSGVDRHKCTSYYLDETPSWLDTGAADGDKMYCTKCKTRVGSWTWAGSMCSCGAWVTPSFQFVKSKLDQKDV